MTRRTAFTAAVAAAFAGALPGALAPRALIAQTPTSAQAPATPVSGYATHVVATHYLNGRAYETHHYFKGLRDGVLQGLVFRTGQDGAALIEVEWAISQAVYDSLPPADRRHWHPLFPAVDRGRLRLPDVTPDKEREMLQTVRGLYAQTLNLAGIDGALPRGLSAVALATHLTAAEQQQLAASQTDQGQNRK